MATAKNLTVVVLDVGSTMTGERFHSGRKAVQLLLENALLYSKYDEVGLVLVGTQETNNSLNENAVQEAGDDSSYKHISHREEDTIARPTLERLDEVLRLQPGGATGDVFEGLIIALDLLVRKIETAKQYAKYESKVFLVTDAGNRIEGAEADWEPVVGGYRAKGVKLNVIGVDFADMPEEGEEIHHAPGKSAVKVQNELLLHQFASQVNERPLTEPHGVFSATDALEIMTSLRKHSVLQRTNMRADLILGEVRIPMFSFKRTQKQSLPTLKKESVLEEKGAVTMQRVYTREDNPEQEVDETLRIKGFRYGKSTIPFATADIEALKYVSEREIRVLGFVKRSRLHRGWFMGTTSWLVGKPDDQAAMTAVAALCQALAEMEYVAIVRYVWRANANPKLGALIPGIVNEQSGAGSMVFQYVALPFSEDIRDYQFVSFSSKAFQRFAPSQDQLAATESLIKAMDLIGEDSDGEEEDLLPLDSIFNPAIQCFNQALVTRGLDAEAEIPDEDAQVKAYLDVHPEVATRAEPVWERLRPLFPLKKNEQKEKDKSRKRFWQDALDGGNLDLSGYGNGGSNNTGSNNSLATGGEEADGDDEPLAKRARVAGLSDLVENKVDNVGTIDPVSDFNAMIARRDDQLFDTAMQQMRERILTLITDSIGAAFFPKATDCIAALRQASVQNEEADVYNEFIRSIKTRFMARKPELWQLIVSRRLGLIACDTVTPADAAAFLAGDEDAADAQNAEAADDAPADASGDIDFDDLE